MIKRLFALLTVCFILTSQTFVYADVIWAPEDNDFFTQHEKECTYVGREYYANGISGFLSIKTAPNSNTEVSKIANGNTMRIQFTCDYNGAQWGVTGGWDDPSGWMPMSQLVLVYDYMSFNEEHKDNFYEYTGDFEVLKTVKRAFLWSWPGSGKITSTIDGKDQYNTIDDLYEFLNEYLSGAKTYKDEQKREWIFVSYMRGIRNVWLCISDPANGTIPAFNSAPQPKLIKDKSNGFLGQNIGATEQLDRRFYVNSPTGYVTPKIEPGSDEAALTYEDKGIMYSSDPKQGKVALTYNNGEIVIIARTTLFNGEYWGVMSPGQNYPDSGWIPMDQLLIQYERQDFETENKDNLYIYTGNYDAAFAAERLVLWQWPGSDREKRIIDDKNYVLKDVDALYAYKDSQGREWGYVNLSYTYTYGDQNQYTATIRREGWICLAEPSDSNIPAFNPAPNPLSWSLNDVYEWNRENSGIKFNDVTESHWAYKDIMSLTNLGVLNGYEDGTFRPDGNITHAEMAKIITIAFDLHGNNESNDEMTSYNLKRDINEYYPDEWWSAFALIAVDYYYPGGLSIVYNSAEEVNRRQVAVVLVNILNPNYGFDYTTTGYFFPTNWKEILRSEFLDFAEEDGWDDDIFIDLGDGFWVNSPKHIYLAKTMGLITGYPDGTFQPLDNITRAEFCAMVNRALALQ